MQDVFQQDEKLAPGAEGSMPVPGTPPPASYEELTTRVCELAAANFALRTKADRDGLIVDSATDFAIITLNLGGQVTNWNTGAQRLLGHSREQAVGQSGAMMFTPEDRAAGVFVEELWRAFEQGSARNERWHVRRDGTRFWASGTMMPLLDTSGMVCGFLNIMRDGTTVAEAEARRAFLLAEAQHKSKNTFATVYAVVARHSGTGRDMGPPFMAKLAALARSHDLLECANATLTDVLERSLAPYADEPGQARAVGPIVLLKGRTAAALNSILHELATNAAKYGAFSLSGGQVSVTWRVEAAAAPAGASAVVILWQEAGGPPVTPPTRRGFGTRVIEGQLSGMGGEAVLDFGPHGVTCRIRLPSDGAL